MEARRKTKAGGNKQRAGAEDMLSAPPTPMAKRREGIRGNSHTDAFCRALRGQSTAVAGVDVETKERLLVCPRPSGRSIDQLLMSSVFNSAKL